MNRSTAAATLVTVTIAFAALALLPAEARAELGDGLPMGPTRLHLGVETDLTYTSEAGAGTFNNVSDPGDLIATFKALIGVEGKTENLKLKFAGDLTWNQYTGLVTPATEGLSFLGADLVGMLQTNPDGKYGFDLTESFARTNQTTNPVFGLGILSLLDDTKMLIRFKPGGGAIEFAVGADLGLNLYSPQVSPVGSGQNPACAGVPSPLQGSCDPQTASAYDTVTVSGIVNAKWRFLPKTGVTFDGSVGYTDYVYGYNATSYPNLNALPYYALVGFGTLLSTRFSFALKIGYQGIDYPTATATNFGTVAGQADIGFRFNETATTRVGFIRNVLPAGAGFNWVEDNRIFFELGWQPMQRLTLAGTASVDFISYGDATINNGRTDDAYSIQLRADYAFLKWLKAFVRGDVLARAASNVAINDASLAAFSYNIYDITAGVSALF